MWLTSQFDATNNICYQPWESEFIMDIWYWIVYHYVESEMNKTQLYLCNTYHVKVNILKFNFMTSTLSITSVESDYYFHV